MTLGAYVHNARLKRLYRFDPTEPMYAGSKLFGFCRKHGMSYGAVASMLA